MPQWSPRRFAPWDTPRRSGLGCRAIANACSHGRAAGERIQTDNWQAALGCRERFADWAAFFAEQLEETEWRALLDHWVMRLGPGFCAAATHGVIRVGHAVRALAERETRSRRRELGDALASWTATWQRLPRSGGAGGQTVSPQDAIAGVPLVPTDRRLPGNIVQALAVLDDFPEFLPVVEMIDTSGPVAAQICELPNFLPACIWRMPGTFRRRSPSSTLLPALPPSEISAAMSVKRPRASQSDTPGKPAARYMLAMAVTPCWPTASAKAAGKVKRSSPDRRLLTATSMSLSSLRRASIVTLRQRHPPILPPQTMRTG